jgi:copper chaperone CopZ
MYGDHHVMEVRRLLLELPGVAAVYASSSFRIVEVQFDDAELTPDQIKTQLDKAGYLGEMPMPEETAVPATEQNGTAYFRHTAAFEQTGKSVGFTQQVAYSGRPLWPCPGMGPISE